MQVRCPHCHNPIDFVDSDSLHAIDCPSCGSSVSLLSDSATLTHAHDEKQTVGHFELIDRLGSGAFGIVWKARDTKLDRTVAIKIPRKDDLSEADSQQFLREARAAAQLAHAGIVSVHEVGRDNDTIYIVSDFVEGVTLADRLSVGPLSLHESVNLCIAAAEALHHAHESGVIHRDLKPSNIMLDLEGKPYLMDFGLARREAGEITMTVEGKILGTPAYMSPEQARGESHHADRRSDVYSLGVILFECLTGELPFRGNARMLIHQVLHDDPPSPRLLNGSIPKDLETICLKCLSKEAGKRYTSALAFAEDLNRFQKNEPIVARPVGRVERLWRWCKRNPGFAALLFLLLATVTATVAVSTTFAVFYQKTAEQQFESRRKAERTANRLDAALKDAETFAGRIAQDRAVVLSEYDDDEAMLWLARSLVHQHASGNSSQERHLRTALSIWGQQMHPRWVALWLPLSISSDMEHLTLEFHPDGGRALITIPGERIRRELCQVIDLSWLTTLQPIPKDVELTDLSGVFKRDRMAFPFHFHWDDKTVSAFSLTDFGESLPDTRNCGWTFSTSGRNLLKLEESPSRENRFSRVELRDLKAQKVIHVFESKGDDGVEYLLSPTKQHLLAIQPGKSQSVIFDLSSEPPLRCSTLQHGASIEVVKFSPKGKRVLTGGKGKPTQLWEVATGRLLHTFAAETDQGSDASFDEEGEVLLIREADRWKVWDTSSGKLLGTIQKAETGIMPYCWLVPGKKWIGVRWQEYSPGGRHISRYEYRHLDTFNTVLNVRQSKILRVCDGDIAFAAKQGKRFLFHTTNGKPISRMFSAPVGFDSHKLSNDGTVLIVPSGTTSAFRLYDTQTGVPLGKPIEVGRDGGVAMTADDKTVLVFQYAPAGPVDGGFAIVRVIKLEPLTQDPEHITLWVENLLGKKLTSSGEVRALNEPELRLREKQLAAFGGAPF